MDGWMDELGVIVVVVAVVLFSVFLYFHSISTLFLLKWKHRHHVWFNRVWNGIKKKEKCGKCMQRPLSFNWEIFFLSFCTLKSTAKIKFLKTCLCVSVDGQTSGQRLHPKTHHVSKMRGKKSVVNVIHTLPLTPPS